MDVCEVWMKYGTGTNKRYIPLHTLAKLLEGKFMLVIKMDVVSGCDTTNNIGTKAAALKKNPEKPSQLHELPPTSSQIQMHSTRCYYVIHAQQLLFISQLV